MLDLQAVASGSNTGLSVGTEKRSTEDANFDSSTLYKSTTGFFLLGS